VSHDDFFAELGIQRDEDAGDAKDKPKSRRQRRMEKVERRQRKRRRHWLTSLVIVVTLVAIGVLGYKAIGIMRDASAQATHAEDYKGEGEGEVTVTIPEGENQLIDRFTKTCLDSYLTKEMPDLGVYYDLSNEVRKENRLLIEAYIYEHAISGAHTVDSYNREFFITKV